MRNGVEVRVTLLQVIQAFLRVGLGVDVEAPSLCPFPLDLSLAWEGEEEQQWER